MRIGTADEDWKLADPGLLLQLLGRAQWIRSFERYVLDLAGQSLVHGPAHSSIGQEGGAVGSVPLSATCCGEHLPRSAACLTARAGTDLYLKNNRRLHALITVICLALLIFCLIERQARQALAARGATKVNGLAAGRPALPTGRRILDSRTARPPVW